MIDAHTHIFNEQVYDEYKARTKGRVEKALTIHYPRDFSREAEPNLSLDALLAFAESKPDLAVVASINFESDAQSQLKNLEELFKQKKIVGLKLYSGYQYLTAADPKVIPFAQLCASYAQPLIIHAGDVYDPKGKALLRYAHPLYIDELAVAVPACRIVIAHLGFPYLMEAANVISKNSNVYGDVSGTVDAIAGYDPQTMVSAYIADLRRMFAYYPDVQEKVIFGTDYGGENVAHHFFDEYVQVVESVFPASAHERVFSGLATELFKL